MHRALLSPPAQVMRGLSGSMPGLQQIRSTFACHRHHCSNPQMWASDKMAASPCFMPWAHLAVASLDAKLNRWGHSDPAVPGVTTEAAKRKNNQATLCMFEATHAAGVPAGTCTTLSWLAPRLRRAARQTKAPRPPRSTCCTPSQEPSGPASSQLSWCVLAHFAAVRHWQCLASLLFRYYQPQGHAPAALV